MVENSTLDPGQIEIERPKSFSVTFRLIHCSIYQKTLRVATRTVSHMSSSLSWSLWSSSSSSSSSSVSSSTSSFGAGLISSSSDSGSQVHMVRQVGESTRYLALPNGQEKVGWEHLCISFLNHVVKDGYWYISHFTAFSYRNPTSFHQEQLFNPSFLPNNLLYFHL